MTRSSHTSKMVALGEMSGNLAHEINNPLTIIQLQSQTIRQQLDSDRKINPQLESYFDLIDKTILRISKIIQSLRNFSRDGNSDPALNTSISDVVKDTLVFCESRFRSAGIKIILDLDTSVTSTVKPIQVSQVILNSLSNSFDAILEKPNDDMWIKIELLKVNDAFYQIIISDSGPAIPPEIQEKMMQPFFTTKPIGKGTGLGLSISKSIIEQHKGKIHFDFTGPHTRLIIELPLLH